MSLRCWLWGHADLDYRFDLVTRRMGYICSRCQQPQALTELPEIAANLVKAEQRAELAKAVAIVAERERQVEARRLRDQMRLVKRA